MMVNPGAYGYTVLKPQINIKYSDKRKKTTYLKPIKTILKPKYKLSGGLVFTFSWPGESSHPSFLPSARPTPIQQTL